MRLEVWGYTEGNESEVPSRIEEVTFAAAPEQLRSIAAFFLSAADKMEKAGKSFDHEHFRDFMPANRRVDIVISRLDR